MHYKNFWIKIKSNYFVYGGDNVLNQIENIKQNNLILQQDTKNINDNMIYGQKLDDFIFNKIMQRTDPIYYCENVLRAHLPERKRHLHENQIELIRAVCTPHYRKVAGLMAHMGPLY